MQRLIEQPTGEGDVLAAGVHLGRVHYHLSVYQHFSANEHDTVPPSLEVEGRLVPSDAARRADLFQQRHAELTLELADGRALEFRIVDQHGAIRSTGRSLYQPKR